MKRISPDQRALYVKRRAEGWDRTSACREVGCSVSWAKMFDEGKTYEFKDQPKTVAAKTTVELDQLALTALDDFAFFAKRYFGLVLQPFQRYAIDRVMEFLATEDEEYAVVNQAPGSGKSTLWTLVLPAWLIARDRRIRGMTGSATDTLAKWYVGNLREVLDSPYLITADPHDKRRGIALDAEGVLMEDYGRFRPEEKGKKWAADAFYVELPDIITVQKEPTWSAFGKSSSFIGIRVPIAVWDDAYDPSRMRSAETRSEMERWWVDVAEKRLDPGGLLILQGQRLDPDDIYQFALKMGGTVIREGDEEPKKYHHIVFKAHYDNLCQGDHGPKAKPYDPYQPEKGGCLLYPKRISWRKLVGEIENNDNYPMLYQQEDVAAKEVLVDPLWVTGGTDPITREVYPGCEDRDRAIGAIPMKLDGLTLSIATADPSPANFWSIQWWLVRVDDTLGPIERYLIDHHRSKMGANEFLDWNHDGQKFVGVMEEWQQRSIDLGAPISHWIFEQSAAQRFVLQYEHARRWQSRREVSVLGHETHRNKSDPEYGVQTMGSHWRYGRVRLPMAPGESRVKSRWLIDEVTRWPKAKYDDCVMSEWFMEWHLPYICTMMQATLEPPEELWRPSFMSESA